jgi:hypothetical protein
LISVADGLKQILHPGKARHKRTRHRDKEHALDYHSSDGTGSDVPLSLLRRR